MHFGTNRIWTSRQCTLAALALMNVSPERHFCILESNFSNREVHLLKNLKISHTVNSLNIVHAVDMVYWNTAPMGNRKADFNLIASKVSASSKVTRNEPGPHDFSTVHYKPPEGWETKIPAHTAIQNDGFYKYAHNLRVEVQLLESTPRRKMTSSECSLIFKPCRTATLAKWTWREPNRAF